MESRLKYLIFLPLFLLYSNLNWGQKKEIDFTRTLLYEEITSENEVKSVIKKIYIERKENAKTRSIQGYKDISFENNGLISNLYVNTRQKTNYGEIYFNLRIDVHYDHTDAQIYTGDYDTIRGYTNSISLKFRNEKIISSACSTTDHDGKREVNREVSEDLVKHYLAWMKREMNNLDSLNQPSFYPVHNLRRTQIKERFNLEIFSGDTTIYTFFIIDSILHNDTYKKDSIFQYESKVIKTGNFIKNIHISDNWYNKTNRGNGRITRITELFFDSIKKRTDQRLISLYQGDTVVKIFLYSEKVGEGYISDYRIYGHFPDSIQFVHHLPKWRGSAIEKFNYREIHIERDKNWKLIAGHAMGIDDQGIKRFSHLEEIRVRDYRLLKSPTNLIEYWGKIPGSDKKSIHIISNCYEIDLRPLVDTQDLKENQKLRKKEDRKNSRRLRKSNKNAKRTFKRCNFMNWSKIKRTKKMKSADELVIIRKERLNSGYRIHEYHLSVKNANTPN